MGETHYAAKVKEVRNCADAMVKEYRQVKRSSKLQFPCAKYLREWNSCDGKCGDRHSTKLFLLIVQRFDERVEQERVQLLKTSGQGGVVSELGQRSASPASVQCDEMSVDGQRRTSSLASSPTKESRKRSANDASPAERRVRFTFGSKPKVAK